jgi:hypothetical protein
MTEAELQVRLDWLAFRREANPAAYNLKYLTPRVNELRDKLADVIRESGLTFTEVRLASHHALDQLISEGQWGRDHD